ncbi:(Fe-S)-binding protein [Nitrosomonas sp. Nm34]|uniref:(Fe-S)-binding protein n=1 Tax=Nitrosomonas sp. Nm34 TaxID=1881055 RepID=UPI0008F40326|nr:(Fe-S)-binding protein [Nitrosomonas sp. Nm34]SFI21031.1 glycolate oxidase iron-sulfur subunit [Nitrosomonas sp. Nm34]
MHTKNDSLIKSPRSSLLAEANRCVSCGLCLPHCPTYRLTLSEADSPRGRIAMISGVASQRIPMNARFAEHIDRCLTCRACEAACPSQVAYGQLIDEARDMLTASLSDLPEERVIRKKNGFKSWLEKIFIDKTKRFDLLRPLIHFFQTMGLQERLQQSSKVKGTKLGLLLAKLPLVRFPFHKWQEVYPAMGRKRGEVALFLGCVARLVDVETNISAIFVLNHLGYTVYVPRAQTCCGALYQHSGRLTKAAYLIEQNRKAFAGLNIHAIISTASGCGSHLVESCSQHQEKNFSAPIMDINQFLAEQDWSEVKLRALPKKVVVHDPCSMRNGLRASIYPYQLLARIPDIEILELDGNNFCCGAAGTYFIDQPEIAEVLLNDKMRALAQSVETSYLVTSNIGCLLHLASGLGNQEEKVEVLHPVTLLARQIGIQ